MERTYKYAVLTAIPDPRRGERVNVGLAVFRPDRIDVRFEQAAYKMRALTGDNWADRFGDASETLAAMHSQADTPEQLLALIRQVEPLLQASDLGWLKANSDEQYEARISEILRDLVAVPRRARRERKSRINTEITAEFRRANALATSDGDVSEGKIARNFTIDEREGLTADFALKNGKLHIANTLDLRKQTADINEAALKSIILDKAKKKYSDGAKTIGVYAIDPSLKEHFKPHIALFHDYADVVYDWQNLPDKKKFTRLLYDAMSSDRVRFI
jgi:hypothetical protein